MPRRKPEDQSEASATLPEATRFLPEVLMYAFGRRSLKWNCKRRSMLYPDIKAIPHTNKMTNSKISRNCRVCMCPSDCEDCEEMWDCGKCMPYCENASQILN